MITNLLLSNDLDQELICLESLKLEYINPEDVTRYSKLLAIQGELFRALPGNIDGAERWLKWENVALGKSALDTDAFYPGDDWFQKSLSQIEPFCFTPEAEDAISGSISEKLQNSDIDLRDLFRWSLGLEVEDAFEAAFDRLNLVPEEVHDLCLEAQRPLFWYLASQVGSRDFKAWERSLCPVCGSSPNLAILLGEEGQRHLVCSMCLHHWPVHRLVCISCGNKDEKQLRYIFVEESDPYRIDICDHCRSYIKTIDSRRWKKDMKIFPRIERVVTIYLDLLAEKEGYTLTQIVQ